MKIRKFSARNFTEALALVKKELGDDAIIISSKERAGSVEVTAAFDKMPDPMAGGALQALEAMAAMKSYGAAKAAGASALVKKPAAAPKTFPAPAQSPVTASPTETLAMMTAPAPTASPSHDSAGIDYLKREVDELKKAIFSMRQGAFEVTVPSEKKDIYGYLRDKAICEELAQSLSEKASSMADLPGMISEVISTTDSSHTAKAVMLIGPTGVGKTTTVAKLAARAMREGKKVALINLDTYRIGAVEQIRIYARIMGIPLDVVSSRDALLASLMKYSDRDVIFIDTTGRNPKDRSYLEELLAISRIDFPIEMHLLMSAASDDAYLSSAYGLYSTLPIKCIGFSKIDEAVRFGSIYNLSAFYGHPVAYLTTGQRVPDDIEFPDAARLTSLVLDGAQFGAPVTPAAPIAPVAQIATIEHSACGVA